jgi:GT2 family glycosyltransferase
MTSVISVIIVTYNSEESIDAAIAPLLGIPAIELIVIDNASVDGTGEILTSRLGEHGWIDSGSNSGFAIAVNRGVQSARGDVVVLLNPDAQVSAQTVLSLADCVRSGNATVAAPLVLAKSPATRLISAGRFPTVWRMFCHYSGLSRLSPRVALLEGHYFSLANLGSSPRQADWVTGACMAIGRQTWDSLGGLTEKWFMYGEDIEICLRVKQLGLSVVLLPELTCEHAVAGSQAADVINRVWIENLAELYHENLSPSRFHTLVWGLVVFLGMSARASALGLRTQSDDVTLAQRRFRAYAHAGMGRAWRLASGRAQADEGP